MALFEDGSYSCKPGIALIAKVLAGQCQMEYTKVTVGEGEISEEQTPQTMTEVAGYVMDGKIASITNPENGECQVTVQINSSDVERGFYCTGILLWAKDPDEGDVPYTYLVLENGPEWIRPKTSAVGKLATFDLIAAIGAVDKVTATIDPNSIVTRDVVEQLIAGATVKREITIPKDGWDVGAEEAAAGAYYLDLPEDGITEEMVPCISIKPSDTAVARDCGMSTAVRSMEGKLRLYAQKAPEKEIAAMLTLLQASSGPMNSWIAGDGYVLPTATITRLGGVKIGGGVGVEEDGTISVDLAGEVKKVVATDSDTEEMLNDVFSEEQ